LSVELRPYFGVKVRIECWVKERVGVEIKKIVEC
jgi:hypothetical protein